MDSTERAHPAGCDGSVTLPDAGFGGQDMTCECEHPDHELLACGCPRRHVTDCGHQEGCTARSIAQDAAFDLVTDAPGLTPDNVADLMRTETERAIEIRRETERKLMDAACRKMMQSMLGLHAMHLHDRRRRVEDQLAALSEGAPNPPASPAGRYLRAAIARPGTELDKVKGEIAVLNELEARCAEAGLLP